MNLNKLVPRLAIRAKLLIAFIAIAVGPLAVLSAVTTIGSVRQLRVTSEAALEYDVDLAHLSVTREIRQAEQHLSFLLEAVLRDVLVAGDAEAIARAHELTSTFLSADSSAVFTVKALDNYGARVFIDSRFSLDSAETALGFDEPLYLWSVEGAQDGDRAIFHVEVRLHSVGTELVVMPAIAIVQAVKDAEGGLLGVVVAEAEASVLFDGLTAGPKEGDWTTGLVDRDGRMLFHSSKKADWASLLAVDPQRGLGFEFERADALRVRDGTGGSFQAQDGRLVSYRPIQFGIERDAPLTLYRTIDASVVNGPVWDFLFLAVAVGLSVTIVVLGVAFVAAEQFTYPILKLRTAVAELAEGGHPTIPVIESNDELEDLARDFGRMADEIIRKRAQLISLVQLEARRRERTEAHLDEVVTHAADAIIGLGRQGEIRLWNRGAERLFKYREQDALGSNVDELIGLDGGHERDFIDRSLSATDQIIGLRTTRRDAAGAMIPVSLTQTAIQDEAGEYVGASLIIRDERVQRELEDQMRRSERLAAISIMAAGLAHELNNPLAVLGNRVELIERDVRNGLDSDRLSKDLKVIRQHVDRIRGVTTDLLNFAREDAREDQVDLVEVVHRVTRLLSHTVAAAGVTLRTEVPEVCLPVHGVEKAIETVLSNLLINAVQATGAGGIVLVSVSASPTGNFAEVSVSDSGPGVPPELRDRIFEPFFTTKGGAGGTGLGLAVCRAVMERHGGSIALRSTEDGGTCFVASFPFGPPTNTGEL